VLVLKVLTVPKVPREPKVLVLKVLTVPKVPREPKVLVLKVLKVPTVRVLTMLLKELKPRAQHP
jgi:hypothetical protein